MRPESKRKLVSRHAAMVDDPQRTPLIQKAIRQMMPKEAVVFEIGAGTGILTIEALKCGAKTVYASEIDRVIEVAKDNVKKAGFDKQVIFYKGLSLDCEIVEKVDMIIAETVGSLGFNENILFYLTEARDRVLKKQGIVIPSKLAVFLAPTIMQVPTAKKEDAFHTVLIPENKVVSTPKKYFEAELKSTRHIGFDSEYTFKFKNEATLTGMAGWIEVEWAPGLVTNASPSSPPTHWKQCFLPFSKPIKVSKKDALLFRLIIGPDEGNPLEALIEWGYKLLPNHHA